MAKLTESECRILESFLATAADRRSLEEIAQRYTHWALLEILCAIEKIQTAIEGEVRPGGKEERVEG